MDEFPRAENGIVENGGSGTESSADNATAVGEENLEPSAKRRKVPRGSVDGTMDSIVLSRDLVVYDRHSQCFLTDGEYELVLSECSGGVDGVEGSAAASSVPGSIGMTTNGGGNANHRISPKKNNSSWETIQVDKKDKVRKMSER